MSDNYPSWFNKTLVELTEIELKIFQSMLNRDRMQAKIYKSRKGVVYYKHKNNIRVANNIKASSVYFGLALRTTRKVKETVETNLFTGKETKYVNDELITIKNSESKRLDRCIEKTMTNYYFQLWLNK